MTNPEANNQIINIGPDEGTITINELVNLCANHLGYNGKPIYFKDRPLEVKNAFCSSDKARRLLDYKTSTNIETAIKETAKYIKKKGIKTIICFPINDNEYDNILIFNVLEHVYNTPNILSESFRVLNKNGKLPAHF